MHIQIERNMSVDSAHDLCHAIEADIKAKLPGIYVVIHVEPWRNR